jgi:hypothetical protein
MVKNEPEEEQQPEAEPSPLEAVFAKLLQAEKKARDATTAKEALAEFKAAVSGLDGETLRRLLAEDGVQGILETAAAAGGSKPGDPILDDKGRELYRIPYSHEWLVEHMPMVKWIVPQEPFGRRIWEHTSWNGVGCQAVLRVGEEVETPSCFRDIVMESWQQITRTLANQAHVLAGVGSRAADGVSLEVGFQKATTQELVASGEWRDTERR